MSNQNEFKSVRKEYQVGELSNESLLPINPIDLFQEWYSESKNAGVVEPNAFALSTCVDSIPSVRIVLLKDFNESGFTFFTNYKSRKGEELSLNENCAGTFYWSELERQVRFEGRATKLSDAVNDEYFESRPKEAQIGAHVSNQSQVISDRDYLDRNYDLQKSIFGTNKIQRPAYWGGYLIKLSVVEFWQGRVGRLHDRIRYQRVDELWQKDRLAP